MDSNADLKKLLDEVAADVAVFMKAEGLGKAHSGEVGSSEVEPDASATTPSAGASDGPPPGGPDDASAGGPPAGGPPADAGGSPSPDQGSAPADGGEGGDPAGDPASDTEALAREYDKLSLDELKAHYLACKSALSAKMVQDPAGMGGAPGGAAPMGGDAGGAPPAPGPDMGASAGAGPGPGAGPQVEPDPMGAAPGMGKSEAYKAAVKVAAQAQHEAETLKKSLDEAKAQLAKNDETFRTMAATLENLQKQPRIKGISATSQVPGLKKSETNVDDWSREEVMKKLNVVARDEKLSKSDRALITKYTVRQVEVDAIKHLLTSVTA